MKIFVLILLLLVSWGCSNKPLRQYTVHYYSGAVDTVWATGVSVESAVHDSGHDRIRHYYRLKGSGGISDLDKVRSITVIPHE